MDSPKSSNPAATSISDATTSSSAALLQSVPSSREAPAFSNLLPVLPVGGGKDEVPRFPGLRRVNQLGGTSSIKRLQGSQSVGKAESQNVDQHRKVFAQPDVEFNDNKDRNEINDVEHDICQRAGGQDVTESNCNSHLLPIAFPMIQEAEIQEKVNSLTMTAAQDIILNSIEASEDKHATLRRCLQFDEVNPNADSKHSDLPATPENAKSIDSSGFDLTATSSMGHQSKSTQPRVPPRAGANTAPAFSRSPGILHLNEIARSLPTGGIATARLSLGQMDNFSLKSESNMNCYTPEPMKNGVLEHFSPSEDSGHESRNLVQSYSVSSLPSLVLKPVMLEAAMSSDSSLGMRKSISQSNVVQVNNKCPNPTKKRKNASIDMDGEGCKRCNCRKTKCLKLYCDCFSAGAYCTGPCACQGCLNKPEYEDTVTEMRQLIESRNPLAFAPKIVQPKTKLPSTSVEGVSAPSSAKHKRGCSCKKSMCLKKYCECYQSNVGCSDGCRCEGCKNVHGRKGDYGSTSEIMDQRSQIENFDGLSDRHLEAVPTRQVLPSAGLYNLRNVSSSAPSLEYSDRGSAVVHQLPCRRSLTSWESDLSILSQGMSLRSPGDLDSYDKYNLIPSGQLLSSVDSVSHPSPSYDGQTNVFTSKPLSNAPSSATASSASSKTKDMSGSGVRVSPGFGSSSFLQHSLTTTSMPRQEGTKHQRSDRKVDMMPEVLENSTPIKPVKVSSPSRKRVSPPHKQCHVFGSSSSAALRSGRKYVLKSISSFPSLTQLIEANGSNQENANPDEYQEQMDN